MTPVFDVSTGGVRPLAGVKRAPAPPAERTLEEERRKPVTDEYVPEGEKKRESYGRYWLGKDESGGPKIYFDGPEVAEEDPASPGAEGTPGAPEKPEKDEEPEAPGKAAPSGKGGKEEKCTGNTDEVDREIKRLKEKKEKLEARLGREADETKREALERQLAQVENELRQKDNDAYRRQHAKFTEG